MKNKGEGAKGMRDKFGYRQQNYEEYNTTSVAYDFEPAYVSRQYEEEERKRRKAQRKKEEVALHREERTYAFKVCIVFSVLFMGCLVLMASHAMVAKQRVVLERQQRELAELKNTNTILSAEITEQMDLDTIKKEAISRLGMVEPQPYQVVYIDVPKQSYTVEYETKEKEVRKSSLFDLLIFWKKD